MRPQPIRRRQILLGRPPSQILPEAHGSQLALTIDHADLVQGNDGLLCGTCALVCRDEPLELA
jgi:hypothetical protein